MKLILPILISICTILNFNSGEELKCGEKIPDSFWKASFEKTKSRFNNHFSKKFDKKKAKNVIIFVGDGLGISTMTAGRIHAGQKNLENPGVTCGAEYEFFFEKHLPMSGLSKTYSINKQTPDSASTATAMFSGKKTEHFHGEWVDNFFSWEKTLIWYWFICIICII